MKPTTKPSPRRRYRPSTRETVRDLRARVNQLEAQLNRCEVEKYSLEPAQGTEARVCHDIARRQQRGISKYGFTVEANPLHLISWLRHAYEECLDQAVYLRRAIEEIENPKKEDLKK